MRANRTSLFILFAIAIIGRPQVLHADPGPVPPGVAVHETKESGVLLLPEQTSKQPTPEQYVPSYRYRIGLRRMPPGLGTYDVKPACKDPKRRRNPVLYDSKELDEFDMTFYDHKDERQSSLARSKSTPTVPYLEGDLYNPHRDKENLQQSFGRFFDIRCLPTRIHYIKTVEGRIEEYLEGSLA